MRTGNKVVFGIYPSRASIERAIETLKEAGFRTSDVSVLMPEGSLNDDLATTKQTKAPEGAAAGAGTGLLLGGALGWLIGADALVVGGLAPLIAAGPLIASLAGAGVGSAIGSLTGGLLGLGIPEYEAKRFEGRVKDGGILLSVHADDLNWVTKAQEILEQTGAEDISSSTEVPSEPRYTKTAKLDGTTVYEVSH